MAWFVIFRFPETPDSPNGIDYQLYVTKKVWSKTVGGEDVIADRIFHYHQVCSLLLLAHIIFRYGENFLSVYGHLFHRSEFKAKILPCMIRNDIMETNLLYKLSRFRFEM